MRITVALLVAALLGSTPRADANELCEAMATDCRAKLLALINGEMVGLDAGIEERKPLMQTVGDVGKADYEVIVGREHGPFCSTTNEAATGPASRRLLPWSR